MPYRQPTRDALEARLQSLLAERGELDADIARTRRMLRPVRVRSGLTRLLATMFWGSLAIFVLVMILLAWTPCRCCHQSPISSTRTDAQSVRSAAVMFVSENPGGPCPVVDDLTRGGYLDRSRRTYDAWEHPFIILCEGDDILVRSAGPDGDRFTADDIQ